MISIYKVTNIINGKIYIGQSKNFKRRINQHQEKNKINKSLLSKAINKYGKDSFIFEEIAEVSEYFANNFEMACISFFDCLTPKGYNIEQGGKCYKMSDQSKNKISQKLKRKKRLPFSQETLLKMSQWQIGRKRPAFSQEWKDKMANSHKGKKLSIEHKNKLSMSQKGKKKCPMEEEVKIKISLANKGQKRDESFSLNQRKRGPAKTSQTGFKGVTQDGNKFIAKIKNNRKVIYCQKFNTAEEAARAYDKSARELFGNNIYLNFKKKYLT